MTWEEMIQRRRLKEARAPKPFDPSYPDQAYQGAVVDALDRLNDHEYIAMVLRFVNNRPIGRVADAMEMSWDGADQLIDRAVAKVHKVFTENNVAHFGGAA